MREPRNPDDLPRALHEKIRLLEVRLAEVLIGKPEVIRLSLVALCAQGHLLIEDVPGVGKTTLAQGLARCLGCSFQRIQFTSDLLPSDVLGVSVYNTKSGRFEFKSGPIFTNIILADEINRASPKTQSCLLEAMNEFQVSLDHQTYLLPRPFMVVATQNPLEYHGTHPLPESQMDRFLLRIRIGYPDEVDERKVVTGWPTQPTFGAIEPFLSPEEVLELQEATERVRMAPLLVDYLMAIIRATRTAEAFSLGASPRAAQALYRAAQAQALLEGRNYGIPDDVKDLVVPVLAHRVILKGAWGWRGNREEAEETIRALLTELTVPE
ncbi:MAG: AAA family ATPase [Candidatus Methylomirabilales bacterium]